MRFAGPDVILFVVGLLLFGGAGYALVAQGGADVLGEPGSPTSVYTVTFPLETVEVDSADAPSFQGATATFQVNATNVKTVIVDVQCSDPVPGGTFRLTVNVEGPNGLAGEPVSGACGAPVQVQVPVAEPPTAATAQGSTAEEAKAGLPASENATAAQGTWTVTVTGSRGGAPIGLPGPGAPGGTILMSVERWEPELSPVTR
ncbi:MAG TPA: hypothetical protein VNX21_02890 [Candidatus Thermoplasmatota archaeon]|nr:hypothetical protein [Candidatus Thermoplasmatota archaeon]